MSVRDTIARVLCTRRDDLGGEASPRGPCCGTMSRPRWRKRGIFCRETGYISVCHLRAPIVGKPGNDSYGQNPISIKLNPKP